MTQMLLSAGAGFALGIVFAVFKLPIPAPITFAGVLGIVGVWGGYTLIERLAG